jgi:hypothetical protein
LGGVGKVSEWVPPEGGRSVADIVEHAMWVVTTVCLVIGEQLGIALTEPAPKAATDRESELRLVVGSAYAVFEELCRRMDDSMLDTVITLPPPARLREGSVDRVIRVMAGYHVIHHAGQVAMLSRRAGKKP